MKEITTKRIVGINEKTLLVTVDIGKTTNHGYWRCPDGTDITPFEFFNDGRGFDLFWERISQVHRESNLEEIVVGFESTGSFAEPLCAYLRKRGAKLVQVNPMHTKRLKELQGNSPNKTDKKDPKVIADIIELGHALTVVVPEGPAAELRRLTQARERCMKRRTALLNQGQDLVFITFPEFVRVMKGIDSRTARELLKKYPTPQEIAVCGLDSLAAMMRRISRGRLKYERALALDEGAQSSVGITEGRESILMELSNILTGLETTEQFISELENRMAEYLRQIPYSRSILSLKGIGKVTAAALIGEVGDFDKFRTIAEMMKLAGLDLFEISSGAHKGKRHISKRGRPLMRKLLYFAAVNTVRKGGIMHGDYQRHLRGGMIRSKALIAVARKLLRIIFALVRNRSEYQKDYLGQIRRARLKGYMTLKEAA